LLNYETLLSQLHCQCIFVNFHQKPYPNTLYT
jgi:hypothetical protein